MSAIAAMCGMAVPVLTQSPAGAALPRTPWTVSWATAQHATGSTLTDQSARMIVHLTQGGSTLRVRLANTLGTTPLNVGSVTVAVRSQGAALIGSTLRTVAFGGSRQVSVPAGGYSVSDPVGLATQPGQDLAVSMYVPGPAVPSQHTSAFDTEYLTASGAGDHTDDSTADAYTGTISSYLIVDAVDVVNPDVQGAIVVVGGSVVDGMGSNRTGPLGTGPAAPPSSRWSDDLARRFLAEQPATEQWTVAEAGISGNTVSNECTASPGTPITPYSNIMDRLDRDVLSLSNVKYIILYAGTNDLGIGAGCDASTIQSAMENVISRAHQHGVKVIVSTITPRASYTAVQNQARQQLNQWITRYNSCAGECDGIVDFNTAIAWFADPNAIDPEYDSGDDIHPNAEGYNAMARSIDLGLFRP